MRDALDVMATKPHAKTAVIEAWSALGDITERALEDETAGEHAFAMFSPRRRRRDGVHVRVRRAPVRQGCLRARRSPPDDAFGRSPRRARGRAGVDAFDGAQRVMDFCLSEPRRRRRRRRRRGVEARRHSMARRDRPRVERRRRRRVRVHRGGRAPSDDDAVVARVRCVGRAAGGALRRRRHPRRARNSFESSVDADSPPCSRATPRSMRTK